MSLVLTREWQQALELDLEVDEPLDDPHHRAWGGAPPLPERRGRLTLDDIIVGAWEGVATHREVSCPVCRGVMLSRYGSTSAPVGGRCRDCGTTLG